MSGYNPQGEPGCDYMADVGRRCGHLDVDHPEGERYCVECTREMNDGMRGFDSLCDNGPIWMIPGTPARSLIEAREQRAKR